MTGKTRQIFLNLIVLLLAICFSFVIAEMIIRAFADEPDEGNWVGSEKKYYEYDPLLGWKKIPNLNIDRVTAGNSPVTYQTNSRGIRGPEYAYDKVDNEYRILILGDSFADGYMVEFHELFSAVLKDKLNKINEDKNYETINTGTTGWSTDQELLFFQKEGKKYNPDLTILMFYENDITYNNQPKDWGMYYKPLFKIKDRALVLTNVPVPKPDMFIFHDPLDPRDRSVFKAVRKWLNVNSYLYTFIKERIKNTYSLRKLVTTADIREKSAREKVFFPIEFRVWEKKYNETVHDAWKMTEKMLVKLREETSLTGSELLVFYVPFEASIYREEWNKIKKKYRLTDDDWSLETPGLVLEEICKRNNIDFINPTSQFREKASESKKKDRRLYSTDHHWSVEGNEFVGEILFEYINSKYIWNRK